MGGYDFNTLASALCQKAFILSKAFLAQCFFKNIFPIKTHITTISPIMPPHPRGHDSNELAFVLYQKSFM
jgi:hypothetical protein